MTQEIKEQSVTEVDPWHERVCPCGEIFRPKTDNRVKAMLAWLCSMKCVGRFRTRKAKENAAAATKVANRGHYLDGQVPCACASCASTKDADRTALIERVAREMGVPVAVGPAPELTPASISARAAKVRAARRAQDGVIRR